MNLNSTLRVSIMHIDTVLCKNYNVEFINAITIRYDYLNSWNFAACSGADKSKKP